VKYFQVEGDRVVYVANENRDNIYGYELYSVPITGGIPTKLNKELEGEESVLYIQVDKNIVAYQVQLLPKKLYSVSITGDAKTKELNIEPQDNVLENFQIKDNLIFYSIGSWDAFESYFIHTSGVESVFIGQNAHSFQIINDMIVYITGGGYFIGGENFELYSIPLSLVTSLSEIEKEEILLYPNPTEDKIKIENLPLGKSTFILSDVMGNEIFTGEAEESFELDLSSFPTGVYTLTLNISTGIFTKKVVKK